MDQSLINRIVEAALLASNQPLSLAQLRELFPEEQPAPPGAVEAAIEQLQAACADRGVELVEVASGFRYQVRAEVHPWVARLWTERQTRYTRATLETLALIAYRQPITRGEIEQVRGVAVSSNIIKALEEREWIRVVGHRDVPGRPALFGTTKQFLDYFGLKRLDELPPLSELRDIGELEPQLRFDETAGVDGRIAAGVAEADQAREGEAPAVGQASGDGADTASVDEGQDGGRSAGVDAAGPQAPSADGAGTPDDDAPEGQAGDGSDQDLDFRSERPVVFDPGDDDDALSDAGEPGIDPEAAPGTRAATENEMAAEAGVSEAAAITALKGPDDESGSVSNAVETTTVPALTTASTDAAESERHD